MIEHKYTIKATDFKVSFYIDKKDEQQASKFFKNLIPTFEDNFTVCYSGYRHIKN